MRYYFIFFLALMCSNIESREYRSIGGYGNNLNHPEWGSSGHSFCRCALNSNSYSDGISEFDDSHLPNPRLVSNVLAKIESDGRKLTTSFTNEMQTHWAQLIGADVTDSISPGGSDGDVIYDVPAGDYFYDILKTGTVKMTLSKKQSYPGTGNGTSVPKTMENSHSSFLDMSWLYGDNADWTTVPGIDSSTGKFSFSARMTPPNLAFFYPIVDNSWKPAGDIHMNQNPVTWSLHDVFAREHNNQVDEFSKNVSLSVRERFEEARRINIAIYQAITFREYLGATIGHPLTPYLRYNSSIDPSCDITFQAAVIRYAHSKLRDKYFRIDNSLKTADEGDVLVRDSAFAPWYWLQVNKTTNREFVSCPMFLRGAANSLSNNVDGGIISELRNYALSGRAAIVPGVTDIFTINIFRGRELGLAKYGPAREELGLERKTTWAEVTSSVPVQNALRELYNSTSPDECDIYVCGIVEEHAPGAVFGETFVTLYERFFTSLRDGDRFYYERDFTAEEIEMIQGIKLKNLIVKHYPIFDGASDSDYVEAVSIPESIFFVQDRQLNSTTGIDSTFFFPNVEDVPGYSSTFFNRMDLAPAYRLYYSISDLDQTITFIMQVRGNGWVGIGFEPRPNSMKGADIYICRIGDNGPECGDYFAKDVGPPILDESEGGSSDVTNVYVQQADGFTVAKFTRPLRAVNDVMDKPINQQGLSHIIFAFHPTTNELEYHGPTRSSALHYDLMDEYTRNSTFPLALVIVIGVLTAIGIIWSIFAMIIIAVKPAYFRYQTPVFCQLILFGTLMGYASVILTLIEPNPYTCAIRVWLLGISYILIFGCLFAKVFRIYRILSSAALAKRVVVTLKDIIKPVAGLLVIEIAFLAFWTGFDLPYTEYVVFDNRIFHCCGQGEMWWWIAFLSYKALFLIVGVFLAVATRKYQSAFNESRQITISLFVILLDLLALSPIGFSLGHIPIVIFTIFCFGIVLPYMFISVALFISGIARIIQGKEAKGFKSSAGGTSYNKTNNTSSTTMRTLPDSQTSPVNSPSRTSVPENTSSSDPSSTDSRFSRES